MKKSVLVGMMATALIVSGLAIASVGDDRTVEKKTVIPAGNVPEIMGEAKGPGGNKEKFVQDEIIVKFKGDERPFRVIKVPAGKVSEKVKEYLARADVEYAEPNHIAYALMVPNDPLYKYQWHLDNPAYGGIQMEEAWDISAGDSSVVVAVVDTGIAYENYGIYCQAPDLAQASFVPGYDFINNDAHPNDDNRHGTHVAGTIAQSTNNNLGVAGVAFKASLMPVKVLDRYGSGTYAQVANGIRYAADNGAKVISLSLGGASPDATLQGAVQYAYGKGVAVIAACGNDNAASCSYPAAYDDYVIAVGATQYDETKAPYSSYGPSLDIVAPGGNTAVDQNGDGYADGVLQQTFAGSRAVCTFAYYFFQGTSMATPHVSGVAALLISHGNADANGDGNTSPDEIRAVLQGTAEDLGAAGRDDTYGYGLVNAYAALQWAAGPPDNETPVITNSTGDTAGTTGEPVNISAIITDNVGVASATVYYTPIDGTETGAAMTKDPADDVWRAQVPVASNKAGAIAYHITAKDAAGNQARDPATGSYSITVADNDPPVANAGPDRSVVVNAAVTLDGSGSSDNIGITSYKWDFDASDGVDWSSPDAVGATATTNYSVVGNYTVTLQVADAAGNTANDTALITVTETPVEATVFEDGFEVGEWNGLWTEDSQNDWFRSAQRAVDGAYSAEVDGLALDAKLTSIPINLQGKANAKITFSWFIETGLDAGEYLAFDVSTDGGTTWVEKKRLRGNLDTENVWHNVSIDLSEISSLQIRFRGKMSDATEDADVDMVKVIAR